MVLTNKQKEELNKAILEYLHNNNLPLSASQFSIESHTPLLPLDKPNPSMSDILEKKWIAIYRLQKKVMELESKIEQITEELSSQSKFKKTLSDIDQDQLFPKLPAKFTLQGHRAVITHLAFHPQYSVLASSSEDASIKLWDFEAGQFEKTLKGHTGTINYISFDLQGKFLASCSSDLTIKLWDLIQYSCVKTLHGHEHSVSSVEFLSNGDFLISASRDKTIKLWEIASGYCKKTFTGHKEWVRRAIVNENSTIMASCSNDQSIIVWNLEKGSEEVQLLEHEHVIECLAFVMNEISRKTVCESEYAKSFFNENPIKEENGDISKNGDTSKNDDISMKMSSKNSSKYSNVELLVSGSRDKTIKLWNCRTGQCLNTFIGHDNWVRGLCFHHSGKFLYSCSDDKSFRIWDLNSGKCVKKIAESHTHFVTSIAANAKYLIVATGSVDTTVKIWECK